MDPILNLADFDKAKPFARAGCHGRVIPQRMEAGSRNYHPRYFYVEYPSPVGQVYQIDASRLATFMADGGSGRRFTASEVGHLIARVSKHTDTGALLKAIKIQS
jgi:hypothetical protein